MSPEAIEWTRLVFSVLAFVVGGGAGVYAWYINRATARRKDVDEEIKALSNRVAQTEADLRHAPSQGQIEQLHRDIAELNGNMRELSGGMNGLKAGMDIIHQHLLSHGGRSNGK